jgi:hypothetical protein
LSCISFVLYSLCFALALSCIALISSIYSHLLFFPFFHKKLT